MDISLPYNIPAIECMGKNQTANKQKDMKHRKSQKGHSTTQHKADKDTCVWDEAARSFDVQKASFDELCEMSSRLYLAGQISLFDHVILIFEPEETYLKEIGTICLTSADAEGRRDWLREYEARSEKDLKAGNMLGYKINRNVLSILQQLYRSRRNMV